MSLQAAQQSCQTCLLAHRLAYHIVVQTLRLVGCNGDSILQTANLIDQTDAVAVVTRPNATLTNGVNRVEGHITTVGNVIYEGRIDLLNAAHNLRALVAANGTEGHTHIGRGVGLGNVDGYTQLVVERLLGVEHQTENTDRTRQRRSVGNDSVSGCRDVVTATCSVVAHRHDDRFLLTQQLHLAPDNLRRQSRATGRIYTQNDRLHLLVHTSLSQLIGQRRRAQSTLLAGALHNLTLGIDHLDLVVRIGWRIGICSDILAQSDHRNILISVQFEHLAQNILNLVLIFQTVDHTVCQRVLGHHCRQVGCKHIERVDREVTLLGDILDHRAPDRVCDGLHLSAVFGAHTVQDVGLNGRLEGTVAEHLRLNAELVERTLVEYNGQSHTAPIHLTHGVEVDAVGHRSEVVTALRVGLAVGNHKFTLTLEGFDVATHLLQQGSRGSTCTRQVDVDTLDVVVDRRSLDSTHNLHIRHALLHVHRHRVEACQRVIDGLIDDRLREVDLQYRLRLDDRGRRTDCSHARNDDNKEEKPYEVGDDKC